MIDKYDKGRYLGRQKFNYCIPVTFEANPCLASKKWLRLVSQHLVPELVVFFLSWFLFVLWHSLRVSP